MANWVARTFRKDDLDKGILDVAGGRGDLSFELSMSHSLACTVVDPRPVRLNKCQHRRLSQALVALSSAPGYGAADIAAAAQSRQEVLEEAKQLRACGKNAEAVKLLKDFAVTNGMEAPASMEKEEEEEEEEAAAAAAANMCKVAVEEEIMSSVSSGYCDTRRKDEGYLRLENSIRLCKTAKVCMCVCVCRDIFCCRYFYF